MKIIETISLDFIASNVYDTYYFKNECIEVSWSNEYFSIVDLKNAQKRGATCIEFVVYFGHECDFLNWINRAYKGDIMAMYNYYMTFYKGGNYERFAIKTQENIKSVEFTSKKGVRVFSPFATKNITKLKAEPKRWGMPHVIKALANNQFENLVCNYVLTDDYLFDDAYNFSEGEMGENGRQALLEEFIQDDPKDWTVYKRDNGDINISCAGRRSYAFTFVLDVCTK